MNHHGKMNKQAERFGWLAVAIIAALLVLAGIQAALASGSCPMSGCGSPSTIEPTPQPGKKKHAVTAQEVVTVGLLIGVPIYCSWKRWVLDDPCVDSSQWRQTSAADDRVTPDPTVAGVSSP